MVPAVVVPVVNAAVAAVAAIGDVQIVIVVGNNVVPTVIVQVPMM